MFEGFRSRKIAYLLFWAFIMCGCLQARKWNTEEYPANLQIEVLINQVDIPLKTQFAYLRLSIYSPEAREMPDWFNVINWQNNPTISEDIWLPLQGKRDLVLDLLSEEGFILAQMRRSIYLQAGLAHVVRITLDQFQELPLEEQALNTNAFVLIIDPDRKDSINSKRDSREYDGDEKILSFWDISHLFEKYNCIVCHRDKDILDLRTMPFQSQKLLTTDTIISSITEQILSQKMPPDPLPKVTSEDFEFFKMWVEMGAQAQPNIPPSSPSDQELFELVIELKFPGLSLTKNFEAFYDQRQKYYIANLANLPRGALSEIRLIMRNADQTKEVTHDMGRRMIDEGGYWSFVLTRPHWQ